MKQKNNPQAAAKELVAQIELATEDEAFDEYGIEFLENGGVLDTIEDIRYKSLLDWAIAQQTAISIHTFEKKRVYKSSEDDY